MNGRIGNSAEGPRQYLGMVRQEPDFTEEDYELMREWLFKLTRQSYEDYADQWRSAPGCHSTYFEEVFQVGDGDRRLLLEGEVERRLFETGGDGYTTERASWVEATIRLEMYECRTTVWPSRENPTPGFLEGDAAACDFDPAQIHGAMQEEG